MSPKWDRSRIIFKFDREKEISKWKPINDNVMGGLSRGSALITDEGYFVFFGTISLENNGGFASIRSLPQDFNLKGFEGIRIKINGDGRKYQFRVRTDGNVDGVAYKYEFQTIKNEWMEIELPFSSFSPTYRGRVLKEVEPLAAEDIRQIGFLIAEKKSGPFKLVIESIESLK